MAEISERRALARAVAIAAGLTVLDSGIATLAYWLLGGENPLVFAGLSAAVLGGLIALSFVLIWDFFGEDDVSVFEPMGAFQMAKLFTGIIIGGILMLPIIVAWAAGQLFVKKKEE